MFSPSVTEGGPATATRSRRRQRPLSSESLVQQPKAKRQRLPLTEQTFVRPDAAPEMYEVKSDKAAMRSVKQDGFIEPATEFAPSVPGPLVARRELSMRSKKPRHGERMSKGDGSVVLVRIASRIIGLASRRRRS